MTKRPVRLLPLLMLAALLTVWAASASAATARPSLTGYQQVLAEYEVGWDIQGSGSVTCPSGTVLVGGGVSLDGTAALTEAINSSAPSGGGGTWNGIVDNPVMAGSDYVVRAECVTKVAKYAVLTGTAVSNPAGLQTRAKVSCPSGTVALGGGGVLSSSSTSVSLNDDYPLTAGKGWSVDANNASGAGDTVQAYVICGKEPAKYAIVAGPGTAVGASASNEDVAICPSGSTVLGGGGNSSSGSPTVNLSGTTAAGNYAWEAKASDTAGVQSVITAYAICTQLAS